MPCKQSDILTSLKFKKMVGSAAHVFVVAEWIAKENWCQSQKIGVGGGVDKPRNRPSLVPRIPMLRITLGGATTPHQ